MKNNNRKGFTLTELVIVIAVIAILAGVLIPTFTGIVQKANKNAALQAVRNAYTEYVAGLTTSEMASLGKMEVKVDGKYFILVDDGACSVIENATDFNASDDAEEYTLTDGDFVHECADGDKDSNEECKVCGADMSE